MKIKVGEWFLAFVIAITAVLLIGLSACKVKTKTVDKDKQDIKIEQTSTTTTVIDTIVKIGGDTAQVIAPVIELFKGDTIIAETNGTVVKLSFDKKTQTVTARAISKTKFVPVQATKTETNNIKSDVKTTSIHKQQTVKADVGSNMKWLFWLFLLAAIIIFVVYQYANHSFPFNLFK